MKRLSRYLAAWLISRHHLAQDAVEVAAERDYWMTKTYAALHTAERAVATAHRFEVELSRSQAQVQLLTNTLHDLTEVEDIAW